VAAATTEAWAARAVRAAWAAVERAAAEAEAATAAMEAEEVAWDWEKGEAAVAMAAAKGWAAVVDMAMGPMGAAVCDDASQGIW